MKTQGIQVYVPSVAVVAPWHLGVYIRWNGMVEWNSGMDYWNGGMVEWFIGDT